MVLGKKRVSTGVLKALDDLSGSNKSLKERLSSCRPNLLSLVFVDLMGSADFEIKFQIVAIQ